LTTNPINSTASQWFHATEAEGNFMGIRYGRIPQGADQVEWSSDLAQSWMDRWLSGIGS